MPSTSGPTNFSLRYVYCAQRAGSVKTRTISFVTLSVAVLSWGALACPSGDVFDRLLAEDERADLHEYLSVKWNSPVDET